ncbi:MAG TPA: ABC transporter ATP-binding protein [Euryarchaeota archaeon]|nr:ABC transporter ATP-binding protein [Euryarchaeota archaeon]
MEIRARELTKRFGPTTALDGVDFSVGRGEIFGVFGPNGAGKTTLLRILIGEIPPDEGQARVLQMDPWKEPMKVKSQIGIVPEVESPPSYLTADEYIDFVMAVRDINDKGAKERWLDFFDLKEKKDTLCKDLSKGMRQKVMLTSAFIHEPDLLLLDEPFINLDPIYQRKLRQYLQNRKEAKKTTFLCTHILEIAQKLCTNVLIIDRGRVVAKGSMEEILAHGNGKLEDLFLRVVASSR